MAHDNKARLPQVQLESWVRQYGGALRNYFRRRAPRHADADDLTQEVFARLARRGNLSDIKMAEAYLFQTANSVLIDSLRRTESRGGSAHEEFEDGRHGTESLDPERVLIGKEGVELLISALYELPEPVRQAFVLYHFEEFRHADIAGKLGISVSTVEKYMARANAHLLARLRDGPRN
ncbi:RNA polymerase sigma factor [Hyphomonas sp.]|uniref:RNA polymerase sigma factor n=1 Tax=Hyphomonas sp. TaxID=87 RepID=UPI003919981D